jgi:hypothetical protein
MVGLVGWWGCFKNPRLAGAAVAGVAPIIYNTILNHKFYKNNPTNPTNTSAEALFIGLYVLVGLLGGVVFEPHHPTRTPPKGVFAFVLLPCGLEQ